MTPLSVKIISPEGVKFQGDCTSLTFPVFDGYYGIQPGYENSFFKLESGTITIKNGSDITKFTSFEGTLMCENNSVTIICK